MRSQFLEDVISKQRKERMGETKKNYLGISMTITGYVNANDIQVTFESGYVVQHTRYRMFLKGSIKDKLSPEVHGIGIHGVGKYSSKSHHKIYQIWAAILKRCYSKKAQEKQRSMAYKGCSVCEEWLNFQNFAAWYESNYYEVPGNRMCVDKDLFYKHNKIYSPAYSCILPEKINHALTLGSTDKRNNFPIGVTKSTNITEGYIATIQLQGYPKHSKTFKNINDAFLYYKIHKESYIKSLADEYKEYLPPKVYDALYSYEVEITD